MRDYGALLLRIGRTSDAVELLRRAVHMFSEQHSLGTSSGYSRSALASAQVKLAAAMLMSNRSGDCVMFARAAMELAPEIASSIDPLLAVCVSSHKERRDTSHAIVHIDL